MDSLLAGSVAGIVADIVTHPIGTIKTRLQVQGASAGSSSLAQYGSIGDAASRILRAEGPHAFFSGLVGRFMYAGPGFALWLPTYDVLKRLWASREGT